ncbi:Peroxisome biogenesis protein 5 [Acorus gramineus]|uniref:Peroxisome biogenesis protein 5 n=1 Tax=Acorus gramineus TaxID=55184 RepID=A0AAV9BBW9_ACOGR|nr:Peroxisome biogenesis protein 5 [Acorus gramineus]
MAMRDLVTGGAACAVPGTSTPANPFGALANAIIGSSGKTQELKGLPGTSITVPNGAPDFQSEFPLTTLPGSEYDNQQYRHPDSQISEFLRGFHSANHGDLAEAWDGIHRPPLSSLSQGREAQAPFSEFEQIYDSGASSHGQLILDGPPQRVLFNFLHSFVESSHSKIPFHPVALPLLGLSEGDKQCIRDRSTIMGRHFFADMNEDYADAQVKTLLHSLDIDSDHRMKGPMRGTYPEFEEYWNESQGAVRSYTPHAANRWVAEFSQNRAHDDPEVWANSFERLHGANNWASEFEQEQSQLASAGHMRGDISNMAAMEQTRLLAQTLAQNDDPKFQNSKFLQFVSKMSRGEVINYDNQVKPAMGSLSDTWANEFANERVLPEEDKWVDEFSRLHQDWGEEFAQEFSDVADKWADSYDSFLNEQIVMSRQRSGSSKSVYVFSDMNPYVGHPNPLKEGQELFRKDLLSEAVLALEAEVLKNPNNAEGWRLLGITHAENDDDQQAIASMMRAQEVDPTNLEVLLALGVSHTNELEQMEALRYLYSWLQHHPKYGTLSTLQQADSLYYADVARLFNEAAQLSPQDADVHIVLGVLYNLSREYGKAIAAFQTALKLKPRDYSLWNKLGATQANSVQSEDAIFAYQQALDLKPNYVRAWANMGISYANQGRYEESIRYYVRALSMNPKADNAWQYLRISLSCVSRNDMFEACDLRNLDALQKEFPL